MGIKMQSNIGHAYKCSGIPMCPSEYHFNMEKPKTVTDEAIKANEKKLTKFLEKYDLNLDRD